MGQSRFDTEFMNDSNQRIVVTGGAGFIGSHLVDRLLTDTEARVTVFDNLSTGRLANLAAHVSNPRLDCVVGDVRDAKTVETLIRDTALVYHIAAKWEDGQPGDDSDEMFTTNVVGTLNVLRAAARQGVERIVFTSSYEAYGAPITLPVDEGHPLLAIGFFGASKAATEAYCRAFHRHAGLKTIILRLGHVYGPRDSGYLIPTWLRRAAAGQDLELADGKIIMDVVWVGVVVEALIRARTLQEDVPPINVASGTGTRLLDLARRIRHVTQGRGQIRILPLPPVDSTRFVANIERMRQVLGIEPGLDPLGDLPELLTEAPVRYDGVNSDLIGLGAVD
jgi:nucleoside-diphosphate-sugar epimerase